MLTILTMIKDYGISSSIISEDFVLSNYKVYNDRCLYDIYVNSGEGDSTISVRRESSKFISYRFIISQYFI